MKTAREHANDFADACDLHGYEPQLIELCQSVFDTCIEVADADAQQEAIRVRYQPEERKVAQRMAEGIARQMRSLRGED